jgi:Phage integrase family
MREPPHSHRERVPIWVKLGIDARIAAAKLETGRLLRPLSKSGKLVADELGDWAIWSVVEQSSKQIGIEHFGAHDLRRTCAKLCRKNGGDLEQIKFLLGHSSIQTTERYLGSEQEIEIAVNDNLGDTSRNGILCTLANRPHRVFNCLHVLLQACSLANAQKSAVSMLLKMDGLLNRRPA